jgi:hypothetical protein
MDNKSGLRRAVERRPWVTFVAVAPFTAFFLWLSQNAWQRHLAFGAAPQDRTAAEALRIARGGVEPWVRITDAQFDCAASEAFASSRYARVYVPGLADSDLLIAQAADLACPAEGAPLVGVVERAYPRLLENLERTTDLELNGVREGAFLVNARGGPSHERVEAFSLLGLAALVTAFGSMGYGLRDTTNKLERGSRRRLPAGAVQAALSRPPLRWRRGGGLALPAQLLFAVACASAFLYLAWLARGTVAEALSSERTRWQAARPVAVRGAPAVVVKSRSEFHDFFADVEVSWQAPEQGPDSALQSVTYSTLAWVPAIRGPVEVRSDSSGHLTNVGHQLVVPRVLGSIGLATALAGLCAAVAWSVRAQWRRESRTRASRRALLERPKVVFLPFVEKEMLTQYGMATGHWSYVFEGLSGERHKATFRGWRKAIFDETGSRVLAVVPEGDTDAEPVLVADDGYPFALDPPPSSARKPA